MHNLRRICAISASRERRKVFSQALIHVNSTCQSSIENPPGLDSGPKFSIPVGILGQATCFSHPHMIPKEHLTCGITQAEYRERRETFVSKLVADVDNMHKTHIIVIPAARKQYMSEKIPYVFRQNSDFFYLTGCLEPSAILVLIKPAQTDEFKSILFVHDKDSHAELWEGPRTGCAASVRLFAVDEARPVENFDTFLNRTVSDSKPSVLWYHSEEPANPDIHQTVRSVLGPNNQVIPMDPQRILHFMRVIKSPAEVELMREACYIGAQSVNTAMACTKPVKSILGPNNQVIPMDPQRILHFMRVIKSLAEVELMREACYIGAQSVNTAVACTKPVKSILGPNIQVIPMDPQRILHFMRVIKSPAEVELIREACYIGAQSVNTAMACTKPSVSEHAINAILEYSSKLQGAEHLAFPPVVGGGPRATHIHYVANNQLLDDGQMLLVDSGCQRWLYNSDISRTWPVSGKFSKYHKILYELVLSVQKRLIELVGSHRPPLDQLFDNMCRLLGARLQSEGILSKNIDNQQLIAEAYRLCPHHVSHYLGLDVHDAPLVRRATPVADNMIVTVEPGIYIRPDDTTIPPEFRGVGIRIEDDVLITASGVEVLTDSCVKEVQDIEAIVGKHSI